VTTRQARAARGAKVLVDWLQNDPSRSTVAPYSLRATAYPTVSTPVSWAELARPERLVFLPGDVLARVEGHGDLFV
jgi:bifunctional non-homologous end joining protein LigD